MSDTQTGQVVPWDVWFEDLRGGRYWCVRVPGIGESIEIHEEDGGEAMARRIANLPVLEADAAIGDERGTTGMTAVEFFRIMGQLYEGRPDQESVAFGHWDTPEPDPEKMTIWTLPRFVADAGLTVADVRRMAQNRERTSVEPGTAIMALNAYAASSPSEGAAQAMRSAASLIREMAEELRQLREAQSSK